jgi:hypothetical protein
VGRSDGLADGAGLGDGVRVTVGPAVLTVDRDGPADPEVEVAEDAEEVAVLTALPLSAVPFCSALTA